jgi:hypothetical protein
MGRRKGSKNGAPLTLEDLLSRTTANGDCLECFLHPDRKNYPQVYDPKFRKESYAHRKAYELANNVTLSSTQYVCHACDNPRCINPAHLWVGTQADNIQDMIAKGRGFWQGKDVA